MASLKCPEYVGPLSPSLLSNLSITPPKSALFTLAPNFVIIKLGAYSPTPSKGRFESEYSCAKILMALCLPNLT